MKKVKIIILVSVFIIIGSLLSLFFFSNDDAFVRAVSREIKAGAVKINLSNLMPGQWELVCSSHPYDGSLYLKEYKRTYTPVASAHDGSWGLIFINSDGSYTAATGSCKQGFNFDIGCIKRDQAILKIKRKDYSCITYEHSAG